MKRLCRLQSQLEAICIGHFSAPGVYNDASEKDIVCLILASFFKKTGFQLFLHFEELSGISLVIQVHLTDSSSTFHYPFLQYMTVALLRQ